MDRKKTWLNFLKACRSMKDEKQLDQFFELFLTQAEKDDLCLRYEITKELLEEKRTQREIADHIPASVANITRGSNQLKRLDKKFLDELKSAL